MSIEVKTLVATAIGIFGGAALTTWCLYSSYRGKIERPQSLSKD